MVVSKMDTYTFCQEVIVIFIPKLWIKGKLLNKIPQNGWVKVEFVLFVFVFIFLHVIIEPTNLIRSDFMKDLIYCGHNIYTDINGNLFEKKANSELEEIKDTKTLAEQRFIERNASEMTGEEVDQLIDKECDI